LICWQCSSWFNKNKLEFAMTDVKSEKTKHTASSWSRRSVLKATTAGAIGAAAATPLFFTQNAWAEKAIGNYPVTGSEVVLGFNVPQTGAYADEGADELRA
jgi:branched-chain amino acid transport system substrate-binding protein